MSDEKAPVIILDKMQEFVPAGTAATAQEASAPQPREHALWLNASALTEEEFEDFTSLFSHYGNGETVVKIKRGSKLYKMRDINDCRGLRDELYIYLSDKDIVRV